MGIILVLCYVCDKQKQMRNIFNRSFVLYLILLVSHTSASSTWTTRLTLNSFNLPIINLCKRYTFLLDTGSKDSWIADATCEGCQHTANVCHNGGQSGDKMHEIKYFKGKVRGDLTFASTCLGSYRFVCVKYAQGMEGVGASGILGLKGEASGKGVVRAMLQNHKIQREAFAIYQGYQENRLFLGDIPQKYVKEEIESVFDGQQWHIKLFGIEICGKTLKEQQEHHFENISMFFDSGSNILILPLIIYDQAIPIITQQMIKIGCIKHNDEILTFTCPSYVTQQQLIAFKTSSNGQLHLNMRDMMTRDNNKYKFRIQKGISNNLITIGGALMKDYLISFALDGTLAVFVINKELFHMQISNFKLILMEYIIMMLGCAFLAKKGYQIAQIAINRKIVI